MRQMKCQSPGKGLVKDDDVRNCFVLRVSCGKTINRWNEMLKLSCEECRSR